MKKRILYVITKSYFGGAQRYVHELALAMNGDYDVAVASSSDGLLTEKLKEDSIKHFPIHSFKRDIDAKKDFSSYAELRTVYKEFKPDVVHLNSSKAGGIGALAARMHGVKRIVFTAHGWPFFEARNFLWKAAAYIASYITALLSHNVIVVSSHSANVFMPFAKHKFSVIHTSVPEIHFLNRIEARDALFSGETQLRHAHDTWLVSTAELTHNKNLFAAVDAVLTYNKQSTKNIFYAIASDGELRDQLQSYIEMRGAADQIQLLGYVQNMREYLKAFDVFLLPSKKEGLPYALLEAGAAGLPSIASNVGGIPEVIDNEKSGLLIDPNDYITIVEAFKSVRPEYGPALLKTIREKFTFREMIKKTEALYFE